MAGAGADTSSFMESVLSRPSKEPLPGPGATPPQAPAAEEEGPLLYYYRVIFETGMPEVGSSDLDPAAFEEAVFGAPSIVGGHRVQWKDEVDLFDGKGKPTGKTKLVPGGSFKVDKVMSVRWISEAVAEQSGQ